MRSGSQKRPAGTARCWYSPEIQWLIALGQSWWRPSREPSAAWSLSLDLNPGDGVPTDCVVNFDNIHTIPRSAFRRQITQLEPSRLRQACQTLRDATGC